MSKQKLCFWSAIILVIPVWYFLGMWWVLAIGSMCLGALGYLDFELNRTGRISLFILFVLVSIGQMCSSYMNDKQSRMELAQKEEQIEDLRASTKRLEDHQELDAKHTQLRELANIWPDGTQIRWAAPRNRDGGGVIVGKEVSAVYARMQSGYKALGERDRDSALLAFKEVCSELPEWPYAYFFCGLCESSSSRSLSAFEDAVHKFENFRAAGIEEPEPLLFEAMALTFLDEFIAANDILSRAESYHMSAKHHFYFFAINSATPSSLIDKFLAKATEENKNLYVASPGTNENPKLVSVVEDEAK